MKALTKLQKKNPGKIEDVRDEGEDGYWIDLLPGYCHGNEGTHHCAGVETVAQAVRWFKGVVPCECDDCKPRGE